MPEIRFYHLEKSTINDAMPPLLQKVIDMGIKSDIIINDDVNNFSDMFWENDTADTFIANETGENITDNSPLAIYNNNELNIEKLRKTRFFVNEIDESFINGADLCCLVFNGNDEKILHQARTFWKNMTEKGSHELTYYYQDPQQGWKKK